MARGAGNSKAWNMSVYRYVRFSTDKQDEQSQVDIIEKYCTVRGIAIDDTIRDEAITGKEGSLSRRDLLKLLHRLREGDTLVVSELSRLTRGGSVELNRMIGDYFRPAKIRLILCNYSMEFDCANLTPMNELILNCFAVFAKMERDSIVERTNAGLNAIKKKIANNGGFIAKRSGQWRTHLGSEKGVDMTAANQASAKASTDRRLAWLMESVVGKYVQSRWQQGWSFTEILADLDRLYEISPDVYCSRTGCKIGKGQLSKMITAYKEMSGAVDMSERDRRNGGR